MTSITNGERAVIRAKEQSKSGRSYGKAGMCALRVRGLYDAPSSGDADRDGDADAVDVFVLAAARGKGSVTRVSLADLHDGIELPGGLPFVIAGGMAGNGHIVVTTGRRSGFDSYVWSPDTLRPGFFDRVTLGRVLSWVSHSTPLGLVHNIGGVQVQPR